ncbi:hypothetical protein DM02DRAFT_661993 [Periconia macrospinosa]|uniref:Uncharacterized protein n=1 Tax=Periconia macrospinosa TaxID=97972 RepID=A0A2V1D5X0_9PLEO|nr:hypothetical protein DM02DRAFT_661993 [Periconia macrospinosa]
MLSIFNKYAQKVDKETGEQPPGFFGKVSSFAQRMWQRVKGAAAVTMSSLKPRMEKLFNKGKKACGLFRKIPCFALRIWQRVKGAAVRIWTWIKNNPIKTALIVMAIVVAVIIAIYLTPVILSAMGFTNAGIAAGSLAASIQSGIGAVTAGSLFAILQSAGAGGAGIIIVNVVVATTAAVVAAVTVILALIKDQYRDEKNEGVKKA